MTQNTKKKQTFFFFLNFTQEPKLPVRFSLEMCVEAHHVGTVLSQSVATAGRNEIVYSEKFD